MRDGLFSHCARCHKTQVRAGRVKPRVHSRSTSTLNGAELFARYTSTGRERRYGLEGGDYTEMMAKQAERCAICETSIAGRRSSGWSRAHIDHDHVTGNVRKLLCQRCNVMVGYIEKSSIPLESYTNYIAQHKSEPSV